jgi:hypothetical protein
LVFVREGEVRWVNEVDGFEVVGPASARMIYPLPHIEFDSSVPKEYAEEFNEALSIKDLSPKSSATLSRRLLQRILREHFNLKNKRDLKEEIEGFIKLADAPAYLTEAVDEIRVIGNYAAHPTKYQDTGEIVEVEPDEADWLLDVIEALLEFAFVQSSIATTRKSKLDAKRARFQRKS